MSFKTICLITCFHSFRWIH